jgi:hypothetical protein
MRHLLLFTILSALVLVACSPGTSPVVSMSPESGSTDVAVDASITATLREAIDSAHVDDVIALYGPGETPVAGSVAYTSATRQITFDPDQPLASETTYTVVVSAGTMSTASHGGKSHEQRWQFTTTPGMVVTAVSPSDGAVDVSLDSLVLMEFRNAVNESELTERFELVTAAGAVAPGAMVVGADGKSATFTPAERLEPGTVYTARIRAKNANSDPYSWSFTTAQDRLNLFTHQAATVVIGKMIGTEGDGAYYPGGNGGDSFEGPKGNPTSWNGALYLPDQGNHRVLVFDSKPTVDGAFADAVIGQSAFGTSGYGNGSDQFNTPSSAAIGNDNLVDADTNNHRVLIWSGVPGSSESAVTVVGQAGFGTSAPACTASGLNAPKSAFAVGGKLLVADTGNNRVLVWNAIPTEDGQPADLVIGQASFGECSANRGATTPYADTLKQPSDVWTDGNMLVVADAGNNRLLLWKSFPASSADLADIAVGQVDFTSNQSAVGPTRLSNPGFVTSNGSQLFVADTNNNRVMVWDTLPFASGAAADIVLGQGGFQCSVENADGTCNQFDENYSMIGPTHQSMYGPSGLHILDGALLVADGNNNRYMIFESQP